MTLHLGFSFLLALSTFHLECRQQGLNFLGKVAEWIPFPCCSNEYKLILTVTNKLRTIVTDKQLGKVPTHLHT